MPSLAKFSIFLRDAIQRHGGGAAGIRSIVLRSIRVGRALGFRGLWGRIRAAQQRNAPVPIPQTMWLSPAAPLTEVDLSLGVMAHVFYPDLLDEFAEHLANLPRDYTLLVSVVDDAARIRAQSRLSTLPRLQALHIRIVPNRGRDIAPFFVTFREEILKLDLIGHIHTKKSLYGGQEQNRWRGYLLDSLLGERDRLSWILGMFQANPKLGIVYPESYASVPLWGHTWLSNAEWGRQLATLLDFDIDVTSYLDFPAGSMFWARTQAIRPLFELALRTESFPAEEGQIDGTLQHAMERMLCLVPRRQGFFVGILPADGRLALSQEGERNRQSYFDAPLQQKIEYFATDATWVSFDVFDTLVVRPFLTARGARAFLSMLVKEQFGVESFDELRTQAEAKARARTGKDVNLEHIYATLQGECSLNAKELHAIMALELSTERRLLKPRQAVAEALEAFAANSERTVVAVSDMYIPAHDLKTILPPAISAALSRLYVSCDTGWRKDTIDGWRQLFFAEQGAPKKWVHIGDNENSDVMQPLHAGMLFPVHVLRPQAYLDVVPALRNLRPSTGQRGQWAHELWLGLITNHLVQLGDRQPELFSQTVRLERPETFGYVVLGPLITDYLTWLARTALDHGSRKILFLSREGYLLHQQYEHIRAQVPALTEVVGRYLLVSRRGVNTPALRSVTDLLTVFRKPYTGSLFGLLDSRLGREVAETALQVLGVAAMRGEVYLPEMGNELLERLRVIEPALKVLAERERIAYLRYWHTQVIDGDQPIVADIGYGGTIQAQLALVAGQALGGAYFAVQPEIKEVLTANSWAVARFHDGRSNKDAPPVLQSHLLLESLLTAPSGQFSHFEQHGAELVARYRQDSEHARQWPLIEQLQKGAEAFVRDFVEVAGKHVLDARLDPRAVQEPLHAVGTGHWQLGAWSRSLTLDDGYTGRDYIDTSPSLPE